MPSHSRASAPLTLVVTRARRDLGDAELAEGLIAGEDWAMEEAWFRFAPVVLTTARRVLGSKQDAEDLAQEVFARVLRQVKTLRQPASLRSFVYSIAIRTLRSQLRYRRVRSWLTLGGSETLFDLGHTTQDVESRDLLRKIQVLLERLSPRDKLIFMLRRVEAMSVEEIAATMDISESTAKRSLAHASERLLRWIQADPSLARALDGRQGVKAP
jgi:RNA polymerase sigma-70 factor, ECF subfamily